MLRPLHAVLTFVGIILSSVPPALRRNFRPALHPVCVHRPAAKAMLSGKCSPKSMKADLKQTIVVENKTGGAGMVGLNEVLTKPKDGYTLHLCSYIDANNTVVYKKASYALADLAPIALTSKSYCTFAVSNRMQVNTIPEFIAAAKAKPGALNYGRVEIGQHHRTAGQAVRAHRGFHLLTGVTFRGLPEVTRSRRATPTSPSAR